MALEDHICLKR